jgi:cell division septation protein DedD
MTQTDGEEKELVLGNKQLISLFFVVVALCGVFFAMGYMIGRNTSKVTAANPDSSGTAAAASPVSQPQDSEPPRETPADLTATPAQTPPQKPAQPVTPANVTQPPASAPADAQPSASAQTQAAHDTPPAPEAGAAMWLQVTALRRADADNLVKTLREQNFPVVLAESSKPDLFRVMVGPYRQTADVADAKARLKGLGFANAFVQK